MSAIGRFERVAAVALRITGLTDKSARFQALSAFTGTGFTTSEAETVVNYPIRRRIVSILMIIGNIGLVTVLATLVVSLAYTDGEPGAVIVQLVWLLGGLALLWFLMLNRTADRIMCSFISNVLESTTYLGRRSFHRLVQVGDGYSVCEHSLGPREAAEDPHSLVLRLAKLDLRLLAVRRVSGGLAFDLSPEFQINAGESLVVFGRDAGHDALGSARDTMEQSTHEAAL